MIVFVGDLHGQFEILPERLKHVPKDATIIQVGDFGFWYGRPKKQWETVVWPSLGLTNPIYAIEGNHEYYPMFYGKYSEPTEIWKGVVYVPRATVLELEGYRIGFMGGGASIDRKFRKSGVDWFPEEEISDKELVALLEAENIDILVTHVPPECVAKKYFIHPSISFPGFGLASNWYDASQQRVEALWYHHNRTMLVCGHMHKSIKYDTGDAGWVRILDIGEVYMFGNGTF